MKNINKDLKMMININKKIKMNKKRKIINQNIKKN